MDFTFFSFYWYLEIVPELVKEFYINPVQGNGFGGKRKTLTGSHRLIQKFSL
jgi:hypothetical protein